MKFKIIFQRCLNEREAKFKALTANIKNSIDNSQPVRSTKLAYVDMVKPPRNVIRKQARFGTANVTSKSSEAKKKIIAAASGAGGSGIPPVGERVPAPIPLGRSRNISKIMNLFYLFNLIFFLDTENIYCTYLVKIINVCSFIHLKSLR